MRAKNMHMGATIYKDQRTIFITGAIDTNDFKIKVRLTVPESGTWNIVKAETNLTNEAWSAWQVGLGFKNSIPNFAVEPICRQFSSAKNCYESNCIIFYQGDIRPGEPILKAFSVEIEEGCTELCLNHNRILKSSMNTDKLSFEEVKTAFNNLLCPEIEILIPSLVINGEPDKYTLPELSYSW